MYGIVSISILIMSILMPESYAIANDNSKNTLTVDPILEINVDGTQGFLRGKQLTTLGKNQKEFYTFRNIPFALEPERFMVSISLLIIVKTIIV